MRRGTADKEEPGGKFRRRKQGKVRREKGNKEKKGTYR